MIGNITLGQYIPGESLLHRADPRIKIVLIFILMMVLFFIESIAGYLAFIMFTITMLVNTRVSMRYILKSVKPVLIILILTALLNIFTIPGEVIFQYKFISISQEGIIVAIKMAVRLVMLILIASVLTLTTTPMDLTDGLERLMKPLNRLKVPVHEIAMMMSIALRFIPTLMEETEKIMKAQASRGADFDTGNIFERVKSFIPILVPLFVSSFKRADDLAMAMESRCYKGSHGRTRMKQMKLKSIDYYIVAFNSLFIGVLLIYEYMA